MTQVDTSAPPSPRHFMESLTAFQRSQALKAAIELDFFTAIGDGNDTVESIARRCNTSIRGTRILCDFLVIGGFLTKDGGRYGLTQDSAVFLNRNSPAYMGSVVGFLGSPMLVSSFDDVAALVRNGGPAGHDMVAPENPAWVDFARSMMPMMVMPARAIAAALGASAGEPWKVLDIAAGHGIFGITIAQENPNARVVALDWPNVLAVAQENAQKFGVANRFTTLPGSAFDVDFGTGYDVVLITNFLHHFDPDTNVRLLRKVHAALKPGGRAATLEFVPNEDRVSPPFAAAFSMMMLGGTSSGDAYTEPELREMFAKAGFASSEFHRLEQAPQSIIVSTR